MKITVREVEYIALAGLGYETDAIGKILCVQSSTVKKTLGNIYKKLNAINRSNAISIAFVSGLLTEKNLKQTQEKYRLKRLTRRDS